jgi:hypothetical protein
MESGSKGCVGEREFQESWWSTENDYYFGYPHAEDGCRNRGQAIFSCGIERLKKDIRRAGRPHSAVGTDVTSHYVRAGLASAYPHPN